MLVCCCRHVGSAGCAGLWQLCDAVRAVGCRSRFVLLAQQANSSLMRQFAGTDPHDVERRRRVSHASQKSSHGRLARGRMTAFLSHSGNWQWQNGSTDAVRFRRRCRIDAERTSYVKACHCHEVGQPPMALLCGSRDRPPAQAPIDGGAEAPPPAVRRR